jgi:NAD(P)-dependent dehydrogenase (short-subunit alcohol dehydrogenase family)
VEQTVARFGRLDSLVNNAAFQNRQEPLERITDEQLERTFGTNIFGYFYTSEEVSKFGRAHR